VATANDVVIKAAEAVLNEDHYGLTKIKERILEYLAVMKLRAQAQKLQEQEVNEPEKIEHKAKSAPTILCFVGPPGVGKTSIGKSIARSLGRKFVKMSLGGIRDEAEIRGHRRTYVGALPGRIIQGIKQAGTKNPVFMLDEIDKVGNDFRGDPSAALLEALDPEQNYAFSDHYLDVPFDLSDVFFITTCNILDTIPPALRDRLEIIHFPGYTEEEKFHIGRDFILEKQREIHGIPKDIVRLTGQTIMTIIRRYTREAGVRSLEREIAKLFRKIAKKIAERNGKGMGKFLLSPKDLHQYLGPLRFTSYLAEKTDVIGMSTGLAWTEAGGEILFIETALMPGKGSLLLTGQLGDVIGPSAGIALTTSLVSAITRIPIRRTIAMTGEVTLRGRVLEIGGVKEKVIAAHRAGIRIIILPKDNKKDLEDIPKSVTRDLTFHFAEHMDEVLKIALTKPLPVKKVRSFPVRPSLHLTA
ncbi:MAG: Lon protease, partial [Microgenomates group bacterium GW2011_GWA2_47_8]